MYADARFSAGEKTMFGYITEMDDAVGEIVGALQAAPGGLYANTVFVFSSDNGAPPAGGDVNHKEQGPNGSQGWIARNHPSRGQKTQIWEGGTKVAGFVAAPGRPDVLPVGDFGVRNGMRIAYNLTDMPTPAEARRIGEPWAPYRSVASWYMWRAVEGMLEAAPA